MSKVRKKQLKYEDGEKGFESLQAKNDGGWYVTLENGEEVEVFTAGALSSRCSKAANAGSSPSHSGMQDVVSGGVLLGASMSSSELTPSACVSEKYMDYDVLSLVFQGAPYVDDEAWA